MVGREWESVMEGMEGGGNGWRGNRVGWREGIEWDGWRE